ncbi:MAG: hypothetical protein AABY95_00335 [Pseudomonadota bacterium]
MLKQCLFIAGVLASSSVLAQFAPKLETRAPSSDETSAEGGAGADADAALKSYLGFDYVTGQLANSVGATASTTSNTFDFDMLRLRGGMRVFEALAVELQYGTSIGGADAGQAKIESYASALLVPTATLFDTFELSFPVGVTLIEAQQGTQTFEDTDISYGIQSELPLKLFADLPDLRLGAGFMIYHAGNASRTYGFNLGLRYDFDLGEFEIVNPITAVRDLFGGGDSEAGTEAEPSAAE